MPTTGNTPKQNLVAAQAEYDAAARALAEHKPGAKGFMRLHIRANTRRKALVAAQEAYAAAYPKSKLALAFTIQ